MRTNLNLIIFAKAPQMGIVKRRLAKDIGHVKATFWYRSQVDNLIKRLNHKLPLRKYLFITPKNSKKLFKYRVKGNWQIKYQSKGHLGERMADAMGRVGNGPCVLIGSDIPNVKYEYIRFAFKELGKSKAIFGPSNDGGYWLIGVAGGQKLPKMNDIRWSTQYALTDTIRCFNKSKQIGYVQTMNDIDNGDDFYRLKSGGSSG